MLVRFGHGGQFTSELRWYGVVTDCQDLHTQPASRLTFSSGSWPVRPIPGFPVVRLSATCDMGTISPVPRRARDQGHPGK